MLEQSKWVAKRGCSGYQEAMALRRVIAENVVHLTRFHRIKLRRDRCVYLS